MKSILRILIPSLLLGLTAASLVQAQDAPKGDRPPRGGRGGRAMDPAQQVQRLDEAVKLTDDQKTKVTAIYKKQADDTRALTGEGGAGGPPSQETMAKMTELRTAANAQIRALLTEDQQKKFDEFAAQQGRGGRRGGPGGGGQRPPPPAN